MNSSIDQRPTRQAKALAHSRHLHRTLRTRLLSALAMIAASCLLLACSTPAQLRLHSLLASDAAFADSPAAAARGGDPIRLVIAPIRVPAAVDQPQWLVRRPDDSLQILEQDRWAAPLADEFRAALRARLGARWGVVDGAAPRSEKAPDVAAWRLAVEVLRLDARPARDVLLDARWTLLPPQAGAPAAACDLRLAEPVRGEGTLPIADAYRHVVARLADGIGAQLRAAQRGDSQACELAKTTAGRSGLQ